MADHPLDRAGYYRVARRLHPLGHPLSEQRIVRTRFKFEREFTQIPNAWLRNQKLSLKARGLLALIMSHEPEFVVTIRDLLSTNPEGRDALDGAIRELRREGHLEIVSLRTRGKFDGTLWELTDPVEVMRRRAAQPELWDSVPAPRRRRVSVNRMPEKPHAGKPAHGSPLIEEQLNSSTKGNHSTRGEEKERSARTLSGRFAPVGETCFNGHPIVATSGGGVPFCALGCTRIEVDA